MGVRTTLRNDRGSAIEVPRMIDKDAAKKFWPKTDQKTGLGPVETFGRALGGQVGCSLGYRGHRPRGDAGEMPMTAKERCAWSSGPRRLMVRSRQGAPDGGGEVDPSTVSTHGEGTSSGNMGTTWMCGGAVA